MVKGVDLTRDNLVRSLMSLVLKKENQKEESFVKILLVYIMEFLLFPTTSYSTSTWLSDYMDDLSVLGRYV